MKTQPKIEQTKDGLLVVRLFQVLVNWDQTWEDAIKAVGPNTHSWDRIWRAAKQYPRPAGKSGVELIDMSLLGYDRNWGSQEAINYAARKNLPAAAPQQVFAIGEAYPHLHKDLSKDYLGAVCLQKCKLLGNVCLPCLWFIVGERDAGTRNFGYKWNDDYWFAVLGEVS